MAGPPCKIAICNHQGLSNPNLDRHLEQTLRECCDDHDIRYELAKWADFPEASLEHRKWLQLLHTLESPQMDPGDMEWLRDEIQGLLNE